MTNEELKPILLVFKENAAVIQIIKNELNPGEDIKYTAIQNVKKENFVWVIDQVIQALEQQPCKDCISRKDTIEWLKKVTVTEGIEFKTGFEQILYDIEQMPSVTPQTVTEFADKCKECGKIKEDLYEKGFEAGKRYIVEQMCALLEKEGKDGDSD